MKKYAVLTGTLIVSVMFISGEKKERPGFAELHKLEGVWIMKIKKGETGEEWHKINDDYMQSRGFFIKDGDTITAERVALRNTDKGIFYTSTVENQNGGQPVDFKLTIADAKTKTFVFENAEHDFPKRIVYEIVSADSLHAFIDGGAGAADKRKDFYYHKAKR